MIEFVGIGDGRGLVELHLRGARGFVADELRHALHDHLGAGDAPRAFGLRIRHLFDVSPAAVVEHQHFCHVISLVCSSGGGRKMPAREIRNESGCTRAARRDSAGDAAFSMNLCSALASAVRSAQSGAPAAVDVARAIDDQHRYANAGQHTRRRGLRVAVARRRGRSCARVTRENAREQRVRVPDRRVTSCVSGCALHSVRNASSPSRAAVCAERGHRQIGSPRPRRRPRAAARRRAPGRARPRDGARRTRAPRARPATCPTSSGLTTSSAVSSARRSVDVGGERRLAGRQAEAAPVVTHDAHRAASGACGSHMSRSSVQPCTSTTARRPRRRRDSADGRRALAGHGPRQFM